MNDIRRIIKLLEQAEIEETYSEPNGALLRYMKAEEFDPYSNWYSICEWIVANNYLRKLKRFLPNARTAEDLQEEDPELFYKLPKTAQEECAKWCIDDIRNNDPANAPTWVHMSLQKKQLLPRSTWLVHFTDNPSDIADQGFTIGMDQMDRLGLTTWIKNDSFDKKSGGYNFAFRALSQYANNAAYEKKYGADAVIFQNSGVEAYHYGDEENQIMFHGKDVDHRNIVVLRRSEGDWIVKGNKPKRLKSGKIYYEEIDLFTGEYENCVKWVIQNFAQYRRVLTRW